MIIKPTIKLTEMCNFNCSYCEYKSFSFTQKNKRIIAPKLAIEIAKQCMSINSECKADTDFCWHGGEPLLYPIEIFDYILNEINNISLSYGIKVTHSLQTNGYLINTKWLDLFSKYHIMVGVSIDGPEGINGRQREKGVVSTILNNINLLKNIGCFSGVLTVLTENHKGKEKELFDFYRDNAISKVGFCKSFNYDLLDTVSNQTLSDFLINFFDIYYNSDYQLNVREYSAYISRILHKKHSNYCFTSCRMACGHFITFNPNGDMFFCDDSYVSENLIGNISETTIIDIFKNEEFQKKMKMIKNVINVECSKCDLFEICGCGCYRNDIDNYSKNYFCSTYKSLIPHIKHRINCSSISSKTD